MKPFLKWAGGKRALTPEILKLFPEEYRTYHEPFLGGGAMYLALKPEKAVLSDANAELMATWQAVRDDVDGVLRQLHRFHDTEEETYYKVRSGDPKTPAGRAARFIYLNKACFNGLYRVNLRGEFNTPWGRRPDVYIVDPQNLRAVSQQLQGATLNAGSFELTLKTVKRGDLVYLDPPYDKTYHAYTERGFNPKQHELLAEWFFMLVDRGARPVLTNSDTPLVRKLFRSAQLQEVQGRTSIAANTDGRGAVTELVISPRIKKSRKVA